jgi:isochorismate hydrolase
MASRAVDSQQAVRQGPGYDQGVDAVFVSDANAALTDAAHNATLENVVFLFGDVVPTDELIRDIHRSSTTTMSREDLARTA